MLNTDPGALARMVGVAECNRDRRIEVVATREQAAMGSMANEGAGGDYPENLAFALYTVMLPTMVTSSPVMSVSSDGGPAERLEAAALQASGSQILRKQRAHEALEASAWDFMFQPYAAGFVEKSRASMSDLSKAERKTMEGRLFSDDPDDKARTTSDDIKSPVATETPNMQIPARWPRLKSVDPRECGFDSAGRTIAEARFTWYVVTADRGDLETRAEEHSDDWYPDSVAGLPVKDEVDRDEVMYYVVYVPGGVIEGTTPTPVQPGTIHTFAAVAGEGSGRGMVRARTEGADSLELRRPFYWEGHPGGPLWFGGQYTTGVDPFFLGVLSANEDSLSMLDAVSAAVQEKILGHTVKFAYDATAEDSVAKLRTAPDGAYIPIPGLRDGNGLIQRMESGELSGFEVQELGIVRETASRAIAVDDAVQGVAKADTTATAVSVAANATRSKVMYLISRWARFVRDGMERMAWEMAHDDRVAVRLDDSGRSDVLRAQLEPLVAQGALSSEGMLDIIEDEKQSPMIYQGGDFAKSDNGLDWHSLNIDIKPGSLEGQYGDEAVARESMWNQQLAFLGGLMLQQPHVDWESRLVATGKALGFPEAASIVDKQIAQNVAQMQLASSTAGQPQLGSELIDAGRQGATLREATGGAKSPSGVDGGQFQVQ